MTDHPTLPSPHGFLQLLYAVTPSHHEYARWRIPFADFAHMCAAHEFEGLLTPGLTDASGWTLCGLPVDVIYSELPFPELAIVHDHRI